MSVAACGGGMGGSDEEERDKITRKRLAEVDLGFVVPNNEDDDDDDDDDDKKKGEDDEITRKIKIYRRRIVLRRIMPIPKKLSKHYPGQSRSFQNLKEICITDAKELRKIKHPFNMMRRRLKFYVNSPLSKMTRAAVLDQDDVVDDDAARVAKKRKGNDSKNQEDGK